MCITVVHVAGVDDRFIRTEITAELRLVFGADGGDDTRAGRFAQLDRGSTHATRRTEDQK